MMRRTVPFFGLVALLLALTPAAGAAGPTHERVVFEDEFTLAPGELCDFEYRQSYYTLANVLTWGDPPTREMFNGPVVVRHTNLDTGYTLTEKSSYMDVWNYGDSTLRQVGLFWHLRDADGKIVVVQAGSTVWNITDWSVVSTTPNVDTSFSGVICPALGGAPVS